MSEQASVALAELIHDERLRPFLPLVYVAWSDGELTANEIEGICTAVADHPGIDADCQVALRLWLDPDHPPSPNDLELHISVGDTQTFTKHRLIHHAHPPTDLSTTGVHQSAKRIPKER
jgi:acyl-CoA oxidase